MGGIDKVANSAAISVVSGARAMIQGLQGVVKVVNGLKVALDSIKLLGANIGETVAKAQIAFERTSGGLEGPKFGENFAALPKGDAVISRENALGASVSNFSNAGSTPVLDKLLKSLTESKQALVNPPTQKVGIIFHNNEDNLVRAVVQSPQFNEAVNVSTENSARQVRR